jgi:hypothetical protein|tara:strand:- start:69 stop:404 length:336 start_codon:yes stop_codon:yes gene_type:complete
LYTRNKLKKDVSINKDVIIICGLLIKIVDKSFDGKNPPDEIIVIARFKELKDLIPNIFNVIKITKVISEYNKKIFKDCLRVSALLKDIKFVKDFLKLRSKISINIIIENKK